MCVCVKERKRERERERERGEKEQEKSGLDRGYVFEKNTNSTLKR